MNTINIYIESIDKPEDKGVGIGDGEIGQQKILVLGGFLFKVARKSRTLESTFRTL